ncbi:MAG: hypothetical protein JRH15_03070 [Deltaproteobacteria bacterium]|nr:hypothetical protein [Deltaproteobacteria bacterium]
MMMRTCVAPSGEFVVGIHKPDYSVANQREADFIQPLGVIPDGRKVMNHRNFPPENVHVPQGQWVYEIPNPLPFRGTTYILKAWADEKARSPERICLPEPEQVSFTRQMGFESSDAAKDTMTKLPRSLKVALAAVSTDSADLVHLAEFCCKFVYTRESKHPVGLAFESDATGKKQPVITDRTLFEVLANNRFLPDDYKRIMVLRPGAQGNSEIVGEWSGDGSHVFEYLRQTSYIPWGHFAANMADDCVRYRIEDLTWADIQGMRHLYYQRIYLSMAAQLGLKPPDPRKTVSEEKLEALRVEIQRRLSDGFTGQQQFNSTLWGWNFGFDYAPSQYRLHASHQQIHQQYALLPDSVDTGLPDGTDNLPMAAYACGDMIRSFSRSYEQETGKSFFETYLKAIRSNRRMDSRKGAEASLVVYEDAHVMLFVPKAQTSQWELQLMPLKPVGNILETDTELRTALDRAMLIAVKVLSALGARMITSIEYSKRFDAVNMDQRLVYAFMPRLPESPGAFSEAQLRWINGHYPEDFAIACRAGLAQVMSEAFPETG